MWGRLRQNIEARKRRAKSCAKMGACVGFFIGGIADGFYMYFQSDYEKWHFIQYLIDTNPAYNNCTIETTVDHPRYHFVKCPNDNDATVLELQGNGFGSKEAADSLKIYGPIITVGCVVGCILLAGMVGFCSSPELQDEHFAEDLPEGAIQPYARLEELKLEAHRQKPLKTLQERLAATKWTGDIPESFCCPISLQLMNDPVMASDGHIYDRANILRIERSPLTRAILKKDFYPAMEKRREIIEFVEQKERLARINVAQRSEEARAEIKTPHAEQLPGMRI